MTKLYKWLPRINENLVLFCSGLPIRYIIVADKFYKKNASLISLCKRNTIL